MIDILWTSVLRMFVTAHLLHGNYAALVHGWIHLDAAHQKMPEWLHYTWKSHMDTHMGRKHISPVFQRWAIRWQLLLTPFACWGLYATIATVVHRDGWSFNETLIYWGLMGAAAMAGTWSYIWLHRMTVKHTASKHSKYQLRWQYTFHSRRLLEHINSSDWKHNVGLHRPYEVLWMCVNHKLGRWTVISTIHLCGVITLRLAGADRWPYQGKWRKQ